MRGVCGVIVAGLGNERCTWGHGSWAGEMRGVRGVMVAGLRK